MRGLISAQESGGIAVGSARTELLGVPGGAVRSGPFLDAATERYQAIVLGAELLGEQIARYEAIEAELNAEDDPDQPYWLMTLRHGLCVTRATHPTLSGE